MNCLKNVAALQTNKTDVHCLQRCFKKQASMPFRQI